MHLSNQYIWLFWSLFSLLPWLLLFLAFPRYRRVMWRANIERVWNLNALSGIRILGSPLDELLLFAISFGMYWTGVYEHFTWTRLYGGLRAHHAA